ncbi:carboxymuconolactone decarboxylase family protein [uncultured Megasphaera sp.]|jgi:4-carboxymuconolactone decarboxylase|uniref:carboxymuconolactone decarboxylase family protein n=1 Tax=uncultured Megasphaera sp. TaxID=165188 RepID=UPI0025EE8BBC|nr:carboxymuconolactone decarboxylase family protein [uncultured Megasphaera sp.]
MKRMNKIRQILVAGLIGMTGTAIWGTGDVYAMSTTDNQVKKAVKIVQTAGRQQLGTFAPDFARYNDDILFGEVWSKNDVLPLRERSIVTVSVLIAQGITDSSLKYHMETAKKNGVTKDEMAEIITQLAFYSGWPKAWAAFGYAKEVYGNT